MGNVHIYKLNVPNLYLKKIDLFRSNILGDADYFGYSDVPMVNRADYRNKKTTRDNAGCFVLVGIFCLLQPQRVSENNPSGTRGCTLEQGKKVSQSCSMRQTYLQH